MTALTMMNAPDVSDLIAGETIEQPRPSRPRALLWMVLSVVLVAVVAAVVGTMVVQNRAEQIVESLEHRLNVQAAGRVALVETWLDGTARLADQLVNNDQFRLFAVDSAADPFAEGVVALEPYMTQVLTDFVQQNGLEAASLLDRDGRQTILSAGAPAPTAAQAAVAAEAIETGATLFSPIRQGTNGLELDVFRPVAALADPENPSVEPAVVAAFMFTAPASAAAAEFLAPLPLAQPSERTALVQTGDAPSVLVPTPSGIALETLDGPMPEALLFGERQALGGTAEVFSVAAPVATVPWLVVQEIDREVALAPLQRTRLAVIIVALLATAVIGSALAAVWFLQSSERNRALAEQFRALAARIDAHRRLLSGINGSIREWIGVKRLDGTYTYVNPAFAEAVGRHVPQLVGQADEAVFGHGTARRLEQSDRQAVDTGAAISSDEQVYIGDRLHHLEISKVPLRREDGRVDGIVSVARDVTELVEQRRKREAAIRRTIDALVKTVELADPYLAGHSRLLNGFSLLVARHLGLSAEETATLEVATLLSQIGKPIVPRDILTKPERLSPDEIKIMESHIQHARAVLGDIEFDLPVTETIYQMYERLDGSGYPNRLRGEEISPLARIMGACDVFCARIRPRSYRSAITPEEALRILAEHPEKYDARVVAALAAEVHTTEGEKLLLVAHAA